MSSHFERSRIYRKENKKNEIWEEKELSEENYLYFIILGVLIPISGLLPQIMREGLNKLIKLTTSWAAFRLLFFFGCSHQNL